MFQNHHWNLFILFDTALILASSRGHIEVVRLLVAQQEVDVNAQNEYLLHSMFIPII